MENCRLRMTTGGCIRSRQRISRGRSTSGPRLRSGRRRGQTLEQQSLRKTRCSHIMSYTYHQVHDSHKFTRSHSRSECDHPAHSIRCCTTWAWHHAPHLLPSSIATFSSLLFVCFTRQFSPCCSYSLFLLLLLSCQHPSHPFRTHTLRNATRNMTLQSTRHTTHRSV